MKPTFFKCTRLHSFFTQGHERTIRAKKNVLISFLAKITRILAGFALVPLSIDLVDPTQYGLWLTISSVIGWFSLFDVGLGNGLRNKLAEAQATGNIILGKIYVSTTYALLCIIVVSLYFSFIGFHSLFKWSWIFNTDPSIEGELDRLIIIVFGFFCLRFVLNLITKIFQADQRSAICDIIDMLSQLIILSAITVIYKTTSGSLMKLGLATTITPVFLLLISSIYFFRGKYNDYMPSFRHIDFKYSKDLMGLGINFFIIQIAALVLFATDNFLIAHLFGPKDVTRFHIANKYFSVVVIIMTTAVSPIWSAVTEAFTKNEYEWIRNIVHKLLKVWVILLFVGIGMLFSSKVFFFLWIGERVDIPFSISISVLILVLLQSFGSIFTNLINGIGKLKIQRYTALATIIFNIPLSIFFAKYLKMGVPGIILGTIIVSANGLIFRLIQYRKIINKRAYGIWGQ